MGNPRNEHLAVSDSAVFVPEDDPKVVSFLDQAFSRAGVTVPIHFAHDGQEAIKFPFR